LLAETGRRVTRWQESPSALLGAGKNKPQTFVVIGAPRREFDDKEIEQILRWVSEGGKLVIIDRQPPDELVKTTASWSIAADTEREPAFFGIDPSDQKQMTEKTTAAKPVQPTVYTNKVNAVQPSRFASSISFQRFSNANAYENKSAPLPKTTNDGEDEDHYSDQEASPKPANSGETVANDDINVTRAPVAHFANDAKTLLVDFPFGAGSIVFLSDPYIVSNGGISLVDNAQMAINIVASRDGLIAFDEFHQGYGAGESHLLTYFAGTPLVAILLQCAALIGVIMFTQSRRFARALPEIEPNRLSKLEYVSAMAELQQRTRAFDLAIENIYTDFRRRVSKLVGADNFTVSLKDLAREIAERGKLNAAEVENLMFQCEDIIRGEPTNKRETLNLVTRLREIEEKLGLQRRKRR
jgi:hypothetical protein